MRVRMTATPRTRQLAGPHPDLTRSRPAEQEALRVVATELRDRAQLTARLDALGDHRLTELVPHRGDRRDDRLCALVTRQRRDERAVDLDDADREGHEVLQRRVA